MTVRTFRQSEIKEFLTCRRKWMLQHYRGLAPAEEKIDKSDLGDLVHAALEVYYKGSDNPLGFLSDKQTEIPEEEQAKWAETYRYARTMVEGYMDWVETEGMDVGLRVVDTESDIAVEFGEYAGDIVVISGRQDLTVFDEAYDLPFLMDHKTVQSLDQAASTLQFDFQLLTYALLRKLRGDPVAGAIHNNLRRVLRTAKSTPPYYGREQVHFNDTQLRNHWRHLHGTLTEMVSVAQRLDSDPEQHQFLTPPRNDKDCHWRCPFIHVCPMLDDGSDAEGFLARFYRTQEAV